MPLPATTHPVPDGAATRIRAAISGSVPIAVAVAWRVIEMDPLDDPRWCAYVEGHPDQLVYQHPIWLRALTAAYGYRPLGLAAVNLSGQLLGVLPLMATRGLLTGQRLVSLPHTPVAGPLADSPDVAAGLVRAAVERARRVEKLQVQVRTATDELHAYETGAASVPWRPTYVVQLPDDPSAIRFGNSRNHSAIKRAVKKAERLGVVVRDAEDERELRAWYLLYLETMRWHGLPPSPYRFFRLLWEELRPRGMLRLLLAEHRESGHSELLGGSICLMAGTTVFYGYNGRRLDRLHLRPNDAIHWRAIHDACRAGYRSYDFGEVESWNQGLTQFKAKWGTEQRQLYRSYYPAPRELERGAFDQKSPARLLATAAWRRLPLAVTVRLGTWLYCNL